MAACPPLGFNPLPTQAVMFFLFLTEHSTLCNAGRHNDLCLLLKTGYTVNITIAACII